MVLHFDKTWQRLLLIIHFIACYSGHITQISDDYTFYYRSYHYELPLTIESANVTELDILDIYNNTYSLNIPSGTITINNDLILDIFNADDWREIHHPDTEWQRRRMWWGRRKRRRCRNYWGYCRRGDKCCKHWRDYPARIPPNHSDYWHRTQLQRHRFVG